MLMLLGLGLCSSVRVQSTGCSSSTVSGSLIATISSRFSIEFESSVSNSCAILAVIDSGYLIVIW